MGAIWVIAEHHDGALKHSALEAVSAAKALGGSVSAVILGAGVESLAGELASHGASEVLIGENDSLKEYSGEGYTQAIAALAAEKKPSAIFVSATFQGKELAARLAAKLNTGLIPDVIALSGSADKISAKRPLYAGKVIATVEPVGAGPHVISLRPKVFEAKKEGGSPTVSKFQPAVDGGAIHTTFKEWKKAAAGKVELSEADIIVSGGRGMKGPENFKLLDELAEILGGAVGASRAVVDAGWMPHSMQVGQTGKTVSPKLYIACAISGAVQHFAGMGSSKFIFAINSDENAPIFKKCDYGLVGDIFQIAPLLTAEFKKALGKS